MKETKFYNDVKSPIFAGMKFLYKNGKTEKNVLHQVGFKIVRMYFDSSEKDCLIGQKTIKTFFYT